MTKNKREWYEHDLFVDVPDRVVSGAQGREALRSRIVWIESIIRAGQADYDRLQPDLEALTEVVAKAKGDMAIWQNAWHKTAALKAILKFNKEWSQRYQNYRAELKDLYLKYEEACENTRTSNTGVKRDVWSEGSGSK